MVTVFIRSPFTVLVKLNTNTDYQSYRLSNLLIQRCIDRWNDPEIHKNLHKQQGRLDLTGCCLHIRIPSTLPSTPTLHNIHMTIRPCRSSSVRRDIETRIWGVGHIPQSLAMLCYFHVIKLARLMQ